MAQPKQGRPSGSEAGPVAGEAVGFLGKPGLVASDHLGLLPTMGEWKLTSSVGGHWQPGSSPPGSIGRE